MNLVSFTIPEEPERLAGWLERYLVGTDLAALVAELAAVHGAAPDVPESGRFTLDFTASPAPDAAAARDLVGARLEDVRVRGLGVLPVETLRAFLVRPYALLELQDLLLEEPSDYWDRLCNADDRVRAAVERGAKRLSVFLRGGVPAEPPVIRARVAWFRRPVFVSLATAAAVLLAVGAALWLAPERFRPGGVVLPAWGWSRPGALTAEASDAAYLRKLADGAGEWFAKGPDDRAALARRLGEFRRGCTTLILQEHPLSPENQEWLVTKCRAWGMTLDGHLQALERGDDVGAVRAAADETVRRLQESLRARADGKA